MENTAITAIAVALHVLTSTWWVGGMLFAYWILRPAADPMDPPERLKLWGRVFGAFFKSVWAAIIIIPATGYWLGWEVYQGFANVGQNIHAMHMIGWIMICLFLWLYFVPYAAFRRALANDDYPAAGSAIVRIRKLVATNSMLGACNVLIAGSGAYWG